MRRFRQAASKLEGHPGLVGVSRGVRRHRGRWTEEETLTCYVRRKRDPSKLPKDELIRRDIDGVPTDVIAIGRARLHAAVDAGDRLIASYDGSNRKSTVSAIAMVPGEGAAMLGSGHGLLPIRDGAYVAGSWRCTGAAAKPVGVLDEPGAAPGFLWFGALRDDADFAVALFPRLAAPPALVGHVLAHAPIPIAPRRVQKRDLVQHVATRRGFRVSGRIVGDAIPEQPIRLRSDDAIDVPYRDVIAVAGESVRFSLPTESGSLVFDEHRRALGFVVGGGCDPDDDKLDITFVLRDFAALEKGLGDLFPLFFTRSSS